MVRSESTEPASGQSLDQVLNQWLSSPAAVQCCSDQCNQQLQHTIWIWRITYITRLSLSLRLFHAHMQVSRGNELKLCERIRGAFPSGFHQGCKFTSHWFWLRRESRGMTLPCGRRIDLCLTFCPASVQATSKSLCPHHDV